jgi:plastocyanin
MMRLLTLVVLVSLALAGCAGSGHASTTQPPETTAVSMAKSYLFAPAAIRVPAGASVTWTNDDNFTHDVHLLGTAEWYSQQLRPGESVTQAFPVPGEYRYECTFHPQNMKGTIVVAAT